MNGIHDMGRMEGLGKLVPVDKTPAFVADWERTTFGVNIMCGMSGLWLGDEHRLAQEQIPAPRWLTSSYYERWAMGVEALLVAKGFVTEQEIDIGKSDPANPIPKGGRFIPLNDVPTIAATNHSVFGTCDETPNFNIGDVVRARNINVSTHTRLPRYVRGKVGTIVAYRGCVIYPDTRGSGVDSARHLYNVRFESLELWGAEAARKDALYIDLFDPYLETAGQING